MFGLNPREADALAALDELAAILDRQREAVRTGEWEAFAEASRRWDELTNGIDLEAVSNREETRIRLESLLAACQDLRTRLADELSRHSASLVSIRQHRHVLHSYGGLGLQTGVSYYIDEKK